MEISQHIKNLLVSNERIILKGFGAFITKQVSAKYDKETETMKPPFKIVTFDKNITEDSGLLSEYISKQEGLTKNASEELIDEFVKTIKTKLNAGQTVEFKDLGTFNQASDGTLDFAFLSEENLLLDAFGLPAVSVSEKKDVAPSTTPPKKKAKVQEKTPVKKEKIEKRKKPKPQKVKKESGNKKRKKWPIFVILFAAIGLILVAIYFFKPDLWAKGYNFSTEKIASVKQMFNKNKGEYDIIDPDKEVEDNNSEIAENDTNNVVAEEEYTDEDDFVDDENVDTSFEDENTNEETDISEEDNINNDAIEETPEVSELETNTTVNSENKGKYYIIIGSVKSEASAKKEQKRFAKKGISTSIIHVPNKNRYRISVGEFNSAKEAQTFYSNLQSKHGNIEAWVWEKR